MRIVAMGLIAAIVSGCQTLAPGPAPRATSSADPVARLTAALAGSFDNHEQTLRVDAPGAAPVQDVRHTFRLAGNDRDGAWMLWTVQAAGAKNTAAAWLMRIANTGGRVALTPYRANVPAALQELADPKRSFAFQADQWTALEPCTQSGIWDNATFSAASNSAACSAVLPGLGPEAALLPIRFSIDNDLLRVATFADTARGPTATEEARRVRWFKGWGAINGGGPAAKAANQDWHVDRDLRLSSEGGRVPLRWRDGSASGWSLELERRTYTERNLAVLQLNVVDDANGNVLTYVWTDPATHSIGMNLGWLQIGFTEEPSNREGARP
ncbi:MAG TPA: hypothetical protein VF132_13470 [Rudaea sp.]